MGKRGIRKEGELKQREGKRKSKIVQGGKEEEDGKNGKEGKKGKGIGSKMK